MSLEQIFDEAYKEWRQLAALYSTAGFTAWLVAIAVASVFIAQIPAENPEQAAQHPLAAVGSMIATLILIAYSIGADYAIYKRKTLGESLSNGFHRIFDVFVALSAPVLVLISGTLAGLAIVIIWHSPYAKTVAGLLQILGFLLANIMTLAPFVAADKQWKNAVEEAIEIGQKKYITLLLINIFYALIYITLLWYAGYTLIGAILFVAIDAAILMHIRNLTYIKIWEECTTHSELARE